MKLVVVSWRDLANPLAGGAEVVVDRLLSGLTERGHDVALVCGGPVGPRRYPVVEAGGTYSQYLQAPLVCARRFGDADLVIDVENGVPYFSPLWRRGPSVCLMHHVHLDQWQTRFSAPVAAACRTIEARAMPAIYRNRMFVAISNSTAVGLAKLGIDPSHIRIIEPGIDVPPNLSPSKSTDPLYVSVCRMVPHKRLELVLEAWRIAGRVVPGRLVVIGDGPGFDDMHRLAGGIPRVELIGHVSEDEKWRLLASSWLIVGASHHEGWGLSFMEAAAAGTPTLATDAVGVRDAVIDGQTGVLVPGSERDLPDALARAWIDLASDEVRRKELAAAAAQRAALLSWDRCIEQWLELAQEASTNWRHSRRHSSTSASSSSAGRRAKANGSTATRSASYSANGTGNRGFWSELNRSLQLFKGFRTQYEAPDEFYNYLARDTVSLVEQYLPVADQRVIDIGGGSGYFAKAFRGAGAESVFIEPFWDEMTARGPAPGYGVMGDGMRLPLPDCSFDISHSSNVIEHVNDPAAFFNEMARVVRPGGIVFLAFTNWFSPFGGHETSPWHYLGGERAVARYERKFGHEPKNRFGSSLYRLDISRVLGWARSSGNATLIDSFPRYYPRWTKPVVQIPGVREFLTWNMVLVLRRHETSRARVAPTEMVAAARG